MKSLITRFKKDTIKINKNTISASLSSVPIDSYSIMKERAIIAWIVYHLSELFSINDHDKEKLFNHAFNIDDEREVEDQTVKYLIKLAETGVKWIKQGEDIEERISELQSIPQEHKELFIQLLKEVEGSSSISPEPKSEDNWEVYKDVIYSATNGSLVLINKSQVGHLKKGKLLCEVSITSKEDLPKARSLAKQVFENEGYKVSEMMTHSLLISEAVTNVLKHALHGRLLIYKDGVQLRFVVEDEGPGFPLKQLPKMVLMSGYSTKRSLGQGFTLMMKLADRIFLETSSTGSTVIIEAIRGQAQENQDELRVGEAQ
ncbi:anti-sigma regulatory factor (Ser/Thr protein kinase) [Alkalibacillus filiformis]|uniref:Anti-sigma regulatory factor (Ser/Thr protein kinase) n=1 Tax=Alkalibacillus filiformis TaxID=200990 RepID=A0ABU0DVQ6_9BACI|nr:ATP-binding protein [Alkalibacillus filiformis]MDQ0352527.1 anti-sigma regulatory factor (Ser/Thr protein kinase) [Alkalibacillus filiformis]